MGSPVRPEIVTPDDAEFQAWKAKSTGNINLGAASDTTSVAHPVITPDDAEFQAWKAKNAPSAKGSGDLGDSLASGLTFGMAPKIDAAIGAARDLVTNHSLSHAGQTYSTMLGNDRQRLANVRARAPSMSAAAEAAGTVVPTVLSTMADGYGPIRTALGLASRAPEMAPAASLAARVGQTARVGAGTGAIIAGANSDGDLPTRVEQTAIGGVTGAALGAGSQVLGEAGGLLNRGLRSALTPLNKKASFAAEQQLATSFGNDGGIEAAAQRGAQDQSIGAPSLVAHSGGPSVNSLAWKSVSTPSKGGTLLANALAPIKQGESAVLTRGLGEASGVGDQSAFAASKAIKGRQQITAHNLYGGPDGAYADEPVNDPEINRTIVSNPRLLDTFNRSLAALGEKATPEEVAAGKALNAAVASGPSGPPEGSLAAWLEKNSSRAVTPDDKARILSLAGETPTPKTIDAAIPIRLLDTMKRGASDVIQSGLAKDATFTKMDAKNLHSSVENILSQVDEQRPKYAQARLVFKNDAERLDAIDQGQGALARTPEEVTAAKNALPQQNQPDFVRGGVDAFRQKIAKKVPGSALTQSVFGSPQSQSQLTALIGDDGRSALDPYLDYGKRVEATHQRVFGGSSTAGNLKVDQPDQGVTPLGAAQILQHPIKTIASAVSKLSTAQQKSFQTALADAIGERLAAPNGTSQAEQVYNRLRELRDQGNADGIGQTAAKMLRLRNAIGIASGVTANR